MKTHSSPSAEWANSTRRNWLAGTAALGAVGATSAQAETVQIELFDNFYESNPTMSIDSLDGDLTGDGLDDIPGFRVFEETFGYGFILDSFRNPGTQTMGQIGFENGRGYFYAPGSNPRSSYFQSTPHEAEFFHRVTFNDSRINGGAETEALLHLLAANESQTTHFIEFIRIIFDDASTSFSIADIMTNYPEWGAPLSAMPVASNAAAISKLSRKIKRERKKLRKARQSGNRNRVAAIRKKLKRFQQQLRALS